MLAWAVGRFLLELVFSLSKFEGVNQFQKSYSVTRTVTEFKFTVVGVNNTVS